MAHDCEMETLESTLRKRQSDILEWLNGDNVSCGNEQKHLDEGTPERAYWNHGYAAALKDVLALLGNTSTPKH